ncbi:hypothetical protein [Glutamicibacter sp.]|jgi:hypothetical protein|uniref:hypothetical protein n=1 Tax=Glutamicibacter sp. TaxID=1931995 RepID=UPI002FDB16A1
METNTVKPESKAAEERRFKAEALEKLHRLLRPGDTLYTILRHSAASGMFRRVSVYHIGTEGEPQWLDGYISIALGLKLKPDVEGLPAPGCGLDVGFEIVYNLGRAMFPTGTPCVGANCASNDHTNGQPRLKNPNRSAALRVATGHRDGGYTFRHRWL